jgi:hypothetical protein
MTGPLRLLLLPLRAPMLLVLLAVSVYLGLTWALPFETENRELLAMAPLLWSAQCAQAMVVVMVCCMPDLLIRRLSMMVAASRVVTLVATLLLVTIGGLYLLHLDVLSSVLILACTVLLARLDLIRIRWAPPSFVLALFLAAVVLVGTGLGHQLSSRHLQDPTGLFKRPSSSPLKPRQLSPGFKRIPLYGRISSQGGGHGHDQHSGSSGLR